ncbi:IS5 family transposase [Tritonibacter mobilis]|uniref:IS5 family transposase n=1 Tax=Tritonibacter mobilis TaxID=379347 RepID=UPI000E0CD39D|nr:IS5 family transposase [Tritonibacter mobilis]
MKQHSFSSFEYSQKKKRTKRDVFLAEMDQVVPWPRLEALIAPHYTKPRKGRPQMPLSVMLRIYFLQQWYGLSDPGAEEALYDIHSMQASAGLDLGHDAIPDETTILNFRHLLERHNLTQALFSEVSSFLEERALLLRGGTIMDATLIAASPSTKNKAGKRDPDMSQTKKGNQWYFGAKIHVGVDAKSGLIHTAKLTKASRHDASEMENLSRPDDKAIFGDKGYVSDKRKSAARSAGVFWGVKYKRKPGRVLSASQKKRNRRHGALRAKVEHVFRVIKCQFGYRRVRYRGLAKNAAQMFTLTALANLYMVRGRLKAESV